MSIQKGQKPAGIVTAVSPLGVRESENQAETKNPYGFKVDMGGKMPNIEYSTSQLGKEGKIPASSGKPLRAPIADESPANPEASMHDQYVKPDQIEHSSGAFNR